MSNREKVVRVSSGNSLLVDNEVLNLAPSPRFGGREIIAEELKRILSLEIARRAIIKGVIANYRKLEELKRQDPDLTIGPPAVFVVRLGGNNKKDVGKVITPEALGGYHITGNKPFYTDGEDIKPPYRAYWDAVETNGYIPFVPLNYGDHIAGGIYLKLRVPKPELEEELGKKLPD